MVRWVEVVKFLSFAGAAGADSARTVGAVLALALALTAPKGPGAEREGEGGTGENAGAGLHVCS